jgi:hypothetical protein
MPVLESWPNMLWSTPGAIAFTVLLIAIRVAWIVHGTPRRESKPKK